MALVKIIFDDATVSSKQDADYYHFVASKKNGVLDGVLGKCVPSVSNSNISFQNGYVQVYGRRVYVESGTRIAITLDGNAKGYVVIKYNLGNNEVTLEKKEGSNFPNLTQEDLMNGGFIYEFPIAKYTKSASSLTLESDWVAPKIKIPQDLTDEAEARATALANAAQSTANTALSTANAVRLKHTTTQRLFFNPSTYEEIPTVSFPSSIATDNDLLVFVFHSVDTEGYGSITFIYGTCTTSKQAIFYGMQYAPIKSSSNSSSSIYFATISDSDMSGNISVSVSSIPSGHRPGAVTLYVYKVGA